MHRQQRGGGRADHRGAAVQPPGPGHESRIEPGDAGKLERKRHAHAEAERRSQRQRERHARGVGESSRRSSIRSSLHGTPRSRFADLRRKVLAAVKADKVCRQLMTIPGVGPVVALAFAATMDVPVISDNHRDRRRREVGRWLRPEGGRHSPVGWSQRRDRRLSGRSRGVLAAASSTRSSGALSISRGTDQVGIGSSGPNAASQQQRSVALRRHVLDMGAQVGTHDLRRFAPREAHLSAPGAQVGGVHS